MKNFSLYFQCPIQPKPLGLYLQSLLLPKDRPERTCVFYKRYKVRLGPILTPDAIPDTFSGQIFVLAYLEKQASRENR